MQPKPRRLSKLSEGDPLNGDDADLQPQRAPVPREPPPQPTPPPSRQLLTTRSRRRRAAPLSDTAMVSFNCNMMVGMRRLVRRFAADHDVDIQDVVEEALARYLEDQGIEAPRRPLDQQQPDQR
ncbi:MAG TPA: hypothetical protein VGJ13_19895 [Pseudonocardiaceae bacterium]|jgi:hypothetical protein